MHKNPTTHQPHRTYTQYTCTYVCSEVRVISACKLLKSKGRILCCVYHRAVMGRGRETTICSVLLICTGKLNKLSAGWNPVRNYIYIEPLFKIKEGNCYWKEWLLIGFVHPKSNPLNRSYHRKNDGIAAIALQVSKTGTTSLRFDPPKTKALSHIKTCRHGTYNCHGSCWRPLFIQGLALKTDAPMFSSTAGHQHMTYHNTGPWVKPCGSPVVMCKHFQTISVS